MGKNTIKPTTVRLEPADKAAIERIREMYGCPSDIAAIRFALRMVAREEIAPVPHSKKDRRIPPHV